VQNTQIVFIFAVALLFSAMAEISPAFAAEDWTTKAEMQVARNSLGVVVVNDKIYAIGGFGSNGPCAFNEEYDPATDTWTFKTPMPTPRNSFAIAVYINKIYCIGGYINRSQLPTPVNEVYDPETDTWATKTLLPEGVLPRFANMVNGKIYLIGGIEYSNDTKLGVNKATLVYDPVADTWGTKTSVPLLDESYISVTVDNKIYVISSTHNQIYNPETDTWSQASPPTAFQSISSGGATTGISTPKGIYVFGANATEWWQPSGQGFTAQSYNPSTNTWTNISPINIVRDSAGVAVVNDKLYVIGGYTYVPSSPPSLFPVKTAFSAANEQYAPSSGNETSNPSNTPPISNETSNTSSASNTSNNSNTSNISNTSSVRITLLSPTNQTYFSHDVSLLFRVDNVSSLIRYSLDGQKATTIAGNTTITGLKNGLHNITIYVENSLGNVEASETSYFNIAEESFPLTSIVVISTITVIAFLGVVVYFKKKPKR
jgi:N-acetylneuraminic acid mutarotase